MKKLTQDQANRRILSFIEGLRKRGVKGVVAFGFYSDDKENPSAIPHIQRLGDISWCESLGLSKAASELAIQGAMMEVELQKGEEK